MQSNEVFKSWSNSHGKQESSPSNNFQSCAIEPNSKKASHALGSRTTVSLVSANSWWVQAAE
jgi:hypothetical protein